MILQDKSSEDDNVFSWVLENMTKFLS